VTRRAVAAALAAAVSAGCMTSGYETKPRVAYHGGDPIVQMTAPGRWPSIDGPVFVPLSRHTDPPFRDERVLGLALAAPPRMFPVGLLDTYEVVDGSEGSTPYVVARCALTDLTAVFDRRVGGRTLTFENSGALWRDMLVMRDRETGSYWTPSTGEAIAGPLAGERLESIPAPVTTADAWRELEPSTSCLETGDLTAVPLRLRLYAASPWQGVSGEKTADGPFRPKESVFFTRDGDTALAFTAAQIRERRKVAANLSSGPITIEWDTGLRAPRAYATDGGSRRELAVIPIYGFALKRHFARVRVL
jgi:hypothetical protein